MIVAITGGTGFIGKKLIEHHVLLNDEVRYLTRNQLSSNISGAHKYIADLTTQNIELKKFLSNVDVLYHLAAELKDENKMWTTNVVGTKNLLEVANGRIKHWVQLSSTGVYGKPKEKIINEESKIQPDNLYEKSKAEADRLVINYCMSENIPFCILRPSNVYGPEMVNQSLFQLIKLIKLRLFFFVGTKGAIMNYIHVDNVIHALSLCGRFDSRKNNHTFIVSDYFSIENMVSVISNALGMQPTKIRLPMIIVKSVTFLFEKISQFPLKQSRIDAITGKSVYSNKSIVEILGYESKISIEQGFKELVLFWKNSKNKN